MHSFPVLFCVMAAVNLVKWSSRRGVALAFTTTKTAPRRFATAGQSRMFVPVTTTSTTTKRWMTESSSPVDTQNQNQKSEKTEEEKAAIKAAREARK